MASQTPSYFTNRVYAIAGGGSGIGLATVKQLLSLGGRVSLADHRIGPSLATDLEPSIPAGTRAEDVLLVTAVDVTRRGDVDAWIDRTVVQWGRLDGAANLAGTIPRDHNIGVLETGDDAEWERVFKVNVEGVRNGNRAQLRYLGKGWIEGVRTGDADGTRSSSGAERVSLGVGNPKAEAGSIVNAGSGLSLAGRGGTSAYTSSKHAVLGLTRCVAREVGPVGTRVNCLCPGYTVTPLMAHSQAQEAAAGIESKEDFGSTCLGRMADPSEVADTIIYLLGDKSTFVTGAAICVDGGWAC